MDGRYILVTGGAGYIGSHTVHALTQYNYNLIILDNLSTGHKYNLLKFKNCISVIGDVNSLPDLDSIFSKYNIDLVIHFAALAYVGESIQIPEKYYFNNVSGTINLISTMLKYRVSKIIFSSSCATYGIPKSLPIVETSPQFPINPYGNSKLMVEQILKDVAKANKINYVIFRYFNAAGADPDGFTGEDHRPETHIIPLFLQAALGVKNKISIFGDDYDTPDGSCIRDYVHVSDLATAHVLGVEYLLRGNRSEIFNLSYNHGYSIFEILRTVERVTRRSIPFEITDRRIGDPPILFGNASKVMDKLLWQPKFDNIELIIEHAWKWILNNKTLLELYCQ